MQGYPHLWPVPRPCACRVEQSKAGWSRGLGITLHHMLPMLIHGNSRLRTDMVIGVLIGMGA